MAQPNMKEFLKAMGRMQEEDYVTSDEFYKLFNAVLEAVKKAGVNNNQAVSDIKKVADEEAKKLEKHFDELLTGVEKRMAKVKDGERGKDGRTPIPGVDYPDYQEIRDFISELKEDLPTQKEIEDMMNSSLNVDFIIQDLEAREGHDRLSYEAIDGITEFIDETMRKMEANLVKGPKFVHGGVNVTSTGGASAIDDLTDVSITSPSNGELLQYNGTAWVNATVAGTGDVTAASTFGTDNVLIKSDGTSKGVQSTGITIADTTDAMSGMASISIDASGSLSFGAVSILSDSAGTTTLSNIDAIDATTETTLEAALDFQPDLAEGNFVDGDKTKLDGIETGADVTDTANVTAAGALMDSEVDVNIKTLSLPGSTTISAFGKTLVDDADAATARTTLGVDAAGTDNSTDVTLAGTPDYITISGQVITRNQIDLTADVTGVLPEANLPDASTTAQGVSELATSAEVDTGTDTGRTITPDALAASYAGTKSVVVQAEANATDLAVGDDLATFYIPTSVGGMNLVGVHAYVDTAGTTGTTDIQIHNETQAADMLTTKITIDSAETSSRTAATAAVIDTANDDVAAGDKIRIDVDAVSTTAPKGLHVELEFRLP